MFRCRQSGRVNKKNPRGIRLDPDIDEEVKKIAELTDLPESEVIRQMVGAGVRAIKKNGYKLELPLLLKVIESGGAFPTKSESDKPGEHSLAEENPTSAAGIPLRKRKSAGLTREQQS
ncbi:MAG: hypothetical protein JWQ04_2828 [Pedosphaera sp.]|nr:hypothetical protein [Pedosphaera sp.]